jgi:rare lipoprotein A
MRLRAGGASLALLLLLAACAGGNKPRPASKPAQTVKIGKPYQVFGVWYYPSDDRDYDETGVASWYGPGFHALDTANGERYDQDDLTAAHKTLPMPSYVEVTNLENGRKLVVRINDRGPFAKGRIIDLSRRSAQLLGVDKAGTAKVRVRRVFPDGKTVVALAAPPPPPPPPPAKPSGSASYVQVAALSDPGRIAWLKGYLAAFGPVITEAAPGGLTRVRLGPYEAVDDANAALAKLRAAGYTDARLIPAAIDP